MDDNLVWSVYERDCLYYHKCKNLEICPNIDDNECYCYSKAIVYPKIIGKCGFECDNLIKPNINIKCYIRFGEICSICLEPILKKSSAWLTPCSHSFHRKCLINNHEFRKRHSMTIENSNEIPCPYCRTGLVDCCVGIYSIDRYNSKYGLDKLENFWLTKDLVTYKSCYKCDKGLGMNKLCLICEQYRITGKYF